MSPSSGTPGTRSPRGSTGRPARSWPTSAISELAAHPAPSRTALRQIPAFARRQARRFEPSWLNALDAVASMSEAELPPMHLPNDGPPQARLWLTKDPVAAARLAAVRGALSVIAAQHESAGGEPADPGPRPPAGLAPADAAHRAVGGPGPGRYGARPWQRELTVATITPLLADPV